MKHIKTKMLTFTSITILLSCLLISAISTYTFSKIYLEELFQSCEGQTYQIMQNVDQRVRSLEDSMSLILTGESISTALTQTNFNHPDGKVYKAYREIDSILNSFERQYPDFNGLVFFNNTGIYKYNYYNPSSQKEDFNLSEEIIKGNNTDKFNWKGIYPVNNQIADSSAYVVTRTFVDYTNLKNLGTAVILLDKDIFSSIYQYTAQTSDYRVYLFSEAGQPAESYPDGALDEVTAALQEKKLARGEVRQLKAKDQMSLYTLQRSTVTGWTVCLEIPINVLTMSVNRLIVGNTLLSILVAVVFGLFLFRYISHITNDIETVANAMQVVEENHFGLRLQTKRKDEIGMIFEGFNAMAGNLRKYFQKAMDEEKSKNEAEIRAMFYQIKPHFLYNTLASIRMFAMKQGCTEIVDMLNTLNRLLRNTINIKDHFIPLEEELRNLRDYIKIYNVRYNNQIVFHIEAEDALLTVKIPNMLIQPLVENAIEHGISSRLSEDGYQAQIDITVSAVNDEILIRVRDNGYGLTDMELAAVMSEDSNSDGKEGHIGIRNIDSRLKILFGEAYGLTMQSEKNAFTVVTLKLKMGE